MTREHVLAMCESNWQYRGIDDASLREMLDEHSAHLADAEAAGRGVKDVVGEDVKSFAADWARARKPLRQRVLRTAVLIPSAFGPILLLSHLSGRKLLVVQLLLGLPATFLTAWLTGDEPLFELPLWVPLLMMVPALPYLVSDRRAHRESRRSGQVEGAVAGVQDEGAPLGRVEDQ